MHTQNPTMKLDTHTKQHNAYSCIVVVSINLILKLICHYNDQATKCRTEKQKVLIAGRAASLTQPFSIK